MNHLLTMHGRNGIRIWVHDGLYRIQRRRELPGKHSNPQEVWESLTKENQVLLFPTWQEAEKYIYKNKIL